MFMNPLYKSVAVLLQQLKISSSALPKKISLKPCATHKCSFDHFLSDVLLNRSRTWPSAASKRTSRRTGVWRTGSGGSSSPTCVLSSRCSSARNRSVAKMWVCLPSCFSVYLSAFFARQSLLALVLFPGLKAQIESFIFSYPSGINRSFVSSDGYKVHRHSLARAVNPSAFNFRLTRPNGFCLRSGPEKETALWFPLPWHPDQICTQNPRHDAKCTLVALFPAVRSSKM